MPFEPERNQDAPHPDQDAPEPELSDDDILDAMGRIQGYLDITTADFRVIYHLAYRHAMERITGGIHAAALMRAAVEPVRVDTLLDEAARSLARQGVKGLPVVDGEMRVVGMLTETDFLRGLGADSFLALLLRLLEEPGAFRHRCHETPVSAAMTAPAVTVRAEAAFDDIVAAFQRHPGRSMPVVDAADRLLGLLLRKEFIAACRPRQA